MRNIYRGNQVPVYSEVVFCKINIADQPVYSEPDKISADLVIINRNISGGTSGQFLRSGPLFVYEHGVYSDSLRLQHKLSGYGIFKYPEVIAPNKQVARICILIARNLDVSKNYIA